MSDNIYVASEGPCSHRQMAVYFLRSYIPLIEGGNWHFFLFPLQNLENMQPCPGNCLEHCTSVRSVTCMLQAMHDLMSLQISYVCRSNNTTDLMLLQISFLCRSHVSLHHLSAYALKKLSADNAFSSGKEVIYHP